MSNLARRIIVAALGAPLLVILARHGSWPLWILIAALQAGVLWEWRKLSLARGSNIFWPGAALAAAGLDALVFSGGNASCVVLFVIAVGLTFFFEVFRSLHKPLDSLGGVTLYLLYAVLPLALWSRLDLTGGSSAFRPAGALTALLLTTWMCDTGAYSLGRAFGKHKLYPAASPNKTVEGFFGGLLFAAVVLPVLTALGWATPHPEDYVVLPLIVGLFGQCGDLLESLMKREVNVKDTSSIFPGHGGFLDRFDSLLLSTPFFFVYLLLNPA